jgi:hypothetical protein
MVITSHHRSRNAGMPTEYPHLLDRAAGVRLRAHLDRQLST